VDSYYWDKQSFAADILTPLRNKDTGTYQKNLWIDGKFTGIKESFSVKPNGMIIIEGLMSLQKDLIDFYDETIWIDLDQIQALQQAKDRDINQKGWDSTEVEKNWKEWLLVQELYIKKEEPDKTSSIIFTNKN
jgi:uridine kinase